MVPYEKLIRDLMGATYDTGYYSGRHEDGQPHHKKAIADRQRLKAELEQRIGDLLSGIEAYIGPAVAACDCERCAWLRSIGAEVFDPGAVFREE